MIKYTCISILAIPACVLTVNRIEKKIGRYTVIYVWCTRSASTLMFYDGQSSNGAVKRLAKGQYCNLNYNTEDILQKKTLCSFYFYSFFKINLWTEKLYSIINNLYI